MRLEFVLDFTDGQTVCLAYETGNTLKQYSLLADGDLVIIHPLYAHGIRVHTLCSLYSDEVNEVTM